MYIGLDRTWSLFGFSKLATSLCDCVVVVVIKRRSIYDILVLYDTMGGVCNSGEFGRMRIVMENADMSGENFFFYNFCSLH